VGEFWWAQLRPHPPNPLVEGGEREVALGGSPLEDSAPCKEEVAEVTI